MIQTRAPARPARRPPSSPRNASSGKRARIAAMMRSSLSRSAWVTKSFFVFSSTEPCGRLRQLASRTSPPARAAATAASTRAPDGVIASSRRRLATEAVGDRLLGGRAEDVEPALAGRRRLSVGGRLPPVHALPPGSPRRARGRRRRRRGRSPRRRRAARILDARRDPGARASTDNPHSVKRTGFAGARPRAPRAGGPRRRAPSSSAGSLAFSRLQRAARRSRRRSRRATSQNVMRAASAAPSAA